MLRLAKSNIRGQTKYINRTVKHQITGEQITFLEIAEGSKGNPKNMRIRLSSYQCKIH